MNENELLIQRFYQAFQAKDKKTMLECYHDEAEFRDPVFGIVRGVAVKAMWLMLIEKGSDIRVEFKNIIANETEGKCDWTAIYTYSKTDRIITNRIKASFKFKDGKIFFHRDSFSLWRWSGMALGFPGYILGFTPFIQNQIKTEAQNGLRLYIKRKRMTG